MILDVLQTQSPQPTTTSPSATADAPSSEYPSDIKLTSQILKLNQLISAIVDEHGTVDGEVKYIDIPEDRMLMTAFNFIFGATFNKETRSLRVFRKVTT